MLASYFMGVDAPEKFVVKEEAIPSPKAGEILIRVYACGVCGTDVHIYKGEKGAAPVTPPVILGHELAGEVIQVGEGVTGFEAGDHVTVDPNSYCGKCRPCRMGKKQNCEHLRGIGTSVSGGFTQYMVCSSNLCYQINKDLDYREAAMAEPLACAIHGIDRANIMPGSNVLVIGGGTIGLLMVQLARLSGAACVMVSEPVRMRRELALQIGADAVIDPMNEDLNERIKEICHVKGADTVIECVGRVQAVEQAISAAAPGGTVLIFSVPVPGSEAKLPLTDVFEKELTVAGSIINPDTQQRAADLINSGRLNLLPMITHEFDLNHLEEAIQMQMSSASIKVMVMP